MVHLHFLHKRFTLSNRSTLKAFIPILFKKEKNRVSEISYVFCSDEYLLEINKQHLQHDFYTDIITFGLSTPGQPVTAEIYISIDRVKDNAIQFNVSFKQELHRVIFHGALHLCGYKDKKKEEQAIMRKMEDKYLGLYFSSLNS
ncbi:rRNA maturation RNase YbeY [Flavitalea flava]